MFGPPGLIFAFSYSIAYTCAITLDKKYHYDALQIGLVLLAFGVGEDKACLIKFGGFTKLINVHVPAGCMLGSILGGRWSDRTFARLKAENGGTSAPEVKSVCSARPKVV